MRTNQEHGVVMGVRRKISTLAVGRARAIHGVYVLWDGFGLVLKRVEILLGNQGALGLRGLYAPRFFAGSA